MRECQLSDHVKQLCNPRNRQPMPLHCVDAVLRDCDFQPLDKKEQTARNCIIYENQAQDPTITVPVSKTNEVCCESLKHICSVLEDHGLDC